VKSGFKAIYKLEIFRALTFGGSSQSKIRQEPHKKWNINKKLLLGSIRNNQGKIKLQAIEYYVFAREISSLKC
jgi:hypothetical protein